MLNTLSFDKLFIGGEWVPPLVDNHYEIHSPHDGTFVGTAPIGTPADIDRAVAAARDAFDNGPWPTLSIEERVAVIRRFYELYQAKLPDITSLTIREMGTPAWIFAIGGKAPAQLALEYLIEHSKSFQVEQRGPGQLSPNGVILRREPMGVVGAIVPWNAPQVIMLAKLIPALIAGCTVVVKPSPEAPIDPFMVADLFTQAGLPKGVLSIVPGGPEAGERLVTHPGVDKITFTGSSATGRRVGSLCGAALKRVSLELGGKSAAIILDDADIASAMEMLKFASFANTGQGCVLQTRVLASRKRYSDVVEALTESVRHFTVGDPADLNNLIGPLVSARQKKRVEGYIEAGIAQGAQVTVGGLGSPAGLEAGHYVKPTVFANVSNDMRIAREEIFGPVLSVIPFDDEEDAVRIANDSEFGLAGSVYTQDVERGLGIARKVRTGTYGVNWYAMDFAGPFGGFKASGIGREFGPDIFHEFTEPKTILPPPF